MAGSATGDPFPTAKSPRIVVSKLAVNRWASFHPPDGNPEEPESVRRCEVSGWYGSLVSALKVTGVFVAVAAAVRRSACRRRWAQVRARFAT